MTEVAEEQNKEITPLQKYQAEYNQLVARLGHCIAQQMQLKTEEESLRSQIVKIVNKAANIAKEKQATESPKLEEVKNGTNG
jgi:hypothetical protein